MKKEEKHNFVGWLKEELSGCPSAVVADYRGLTVAQITDLRSRCRQAGVRIKVTKNTLTLLAVKETPLSGLGEYLTGPTILAWHQEDPGAAARVMADFAKEKGHEALEIKGGAVAGKQVSAGQVINVLAKLPTRDELLGILAVVMSAAGAQRLHRLMKDPAARMLRVLTALKEQKGA